MDSTFSNNSRDELMGLFAAVLDTSSDLPPVSHHAIVEARDEQDLEDAIDDAIDGIEHRSRHLAPGRFFGATASQLAATLGDGNVGHGLQVAQMLGTILGAFRQLSQGLQDSGKLQPTTTASWRELLCDPHLPAPLRRATLDMIAGIVAADAIARAVTVGVRLEQWKANRLLDLASTSTRTLLDWLRDFATDLEVLRSNKNHVPAQVERAENVAAGIRRLCEAAPAGAKLFPTTPLE